MARTPKNTVDYFPHDAHASTESATLAVLEGQYNNDGYAFWFKLLEKLASSDGHFLDWSDSRRLPVFCGKVHITEKQGVEMLNLLVEMGAIDKDLWETNRIIWCQNLVDNLAEVYRNRRREMPLKPLSTPIKLISTGRNPITTVEIAIPTDERKGKETIREESREEETKEKVSLFDPSIENVIEAYEKNICLPGTIIDEETENQLKVAVQQFSATWVIDAIREACLQNNPTLRYIHGILKTWQREGKSL